MRRKTVRAMSTKDNPGTLPVELYDVTPEARPIYFDKIVDKVTDGRDGNVHLTKRITILLKDM